MFSIFFDIWTPVHDINISMALHLMIFDDFNDFDDFEDFDEKSVDCHGNINVVHGCAKIKKYQNRLKCVQILHNYQRN